MAWSTPKILAEVNKKNNYYSTPKNIPIAPKNYPTGHDTALPPSPNYPKQHPQNFELVYGLEESSIYARLSYGCQLLGVSI